MQHAGQNPIVRELVRINSKLFAQPNTSCDLLRTMVLPSDDVNWSIPGQQDCGDFLGALLRTLVGQECDAGAEMDLVLCLATETAALCQSCRSCRINVVPEHWYVYPLSMASTLDQCFNNALAPRRVFQDICQCSTLVGQPRMFQEQSRVNK